MFNSNKQQEEEEERRAGSRESGGGEGGGGWGVCIFKNAATVRHKIYLMKLKVALRTSL